MEEPNEIRAMAYEIQSAYIENKTRGEAIDRVKEKLPHADLNILWAMWAAIDAYVDINTH